MKLDKATAVSMQAVMMFASTVVFAFVGSDVISGKAATVVILLMHSAKDAFNWWMTAQGFDRLPNGEQLPQEAKTLPPGIQLQEPIAKRVEQERP